MAAALRALRHRPAALPGRLLPSSPPGSCAELLDAAAAYSFPGTRAVQSPPTMPPSVLRRYYSSSSRGVDAAAASLLSMRRANASPVRVPALVRLQGSANGVLGRASPLPLFVPCRAYSSKNRAIQELEKVHRRRIAWLKRFYWLWVVSSALLGSYCFLEIHRLVRERDEAEARRVAALGDADLA